MIRSLKPFFVLYSDQGEQKFVLEKDYDIKIGRTNDNDIVILDQWISRHHAIVKKVDEITYCLIDLGTKNGTFINGKSVDSPTILEDQDQILLGQTQLVFFQPSFPPIQKSNLVLQTDREDFDEDFDTNIEGEQSGTYLESKQDESLLKVRATPLMFVMMIYLDNVLEIQEALTPHIKRQFLEDLYYQLKENFKKLDGYLYGYHEQYLIGLWLRDSSEKFGFDGLKMLKLLLTLPQLIKDLEQKYNLTVPLLIRCLNHASYYEAITEKPFELLAIQQLLQEPVIRETFNLMKGIDELDFELFWSQKAYDHLVYFPEIRQKVQCYIVNNSTLQLSSKVYGLKINTFNELNIINPLFDFIHSLSAEIVAIIFNAQIGQILDYNIFNLEPDSEPYQKNTIYLQKLQMFQPQMEAETEAKLYLILAIMAGGNQQSCDYFQQGLKLLQTSNNLVYKACFSYGLGSYFYSVAWQSLFTDRENLQRAYLHFECTFQYLEILKRDDRQAKMIHLLAEILYYLQDWQSLKPLIQKAIELDRNYSSPLQKARDLVYLAQITMAQAQYQKAEKIMKKAFIILLEQQNLREEVLWQDQGWFLLTIGEIQIKLGLIKEAINNFNRSKNCLENINHIPYQIRLFNQLYSCYLDQNKLLKAFQIKQEKDRIEQQFSHHYFPLFGGLSSRKILHNYQFISEHYYQQRLQEKILENILLSSRKKEGNYLINKINLNQQKSLIFHGDNDQGKSVFLRLAVVPLLESNYVSIKWSCYLLDDYVKWWEKLGNFFLRILQEIEQYQKIKNRLIKEVKDLKQLATIVSNKLDKNHQVLIIFDQLEYFFFASYKKEKKQNLLGEFLEHIMQLSNFKFILSLPTGNLGDLFRWHSYTNEQRGGGLWLESKDFYALEELQAEEIKGEWKTLYEKFNFPFSPDLIAVILEDLNSQFSPIKASALHLLMAQLEQKQIFTLQAYEENFGQEPSKRLIKIWLETLNAILEDCGEGNQALAKTILFFLTEHQRISLVAKTVRELIKDLKLVNYPFKLSQIELILEVFVQSHFLIKIVRPPEIKYQLAHQILIPYIRRNYNYSNPI